MINKRVYSGYDIPAYHARLSKAMSRYGVPRGAPRVWLRDPDYQVMDHLRYVQPSAAMYWQCYLFAALQDAGVDQHPDLSTITILDKRWHFGERNWNFAPRKIEYQVRRALKGLDYLVVIEFETYRNVRYLEPLPSGSVLGHHDHGRLITPHLQGLIWGKAPSQQQRACFAGGLFGSPGGKLIGVHDFPGALKYMGKPPYRGRSIFRLTSGRKITRPWPDMSLTLHHLMVRHLHQYCWPELTFASGEGSAILAHAKRLWRDYKPGSTHPTDYRPALHSGLVKQRYP
jgi:hypothetical protein